MQIFGVFFPRSNKGALTKIDQVVQVVSISDLLINFMEANKKVKLTSHKNIENTIS
jgi:hypothetical protein